MPPGLIARNCNPPTLNAEFQKGVGLIPVRGNTPSIGGRVV